MHLCWIKTLFLSGGGGGGERADSKLLYFFLHIYSLQIIIRGLSILFHMYMQLLKITIGFIRLNTSLDVIKNYFI